MRKWREFLPTRRKGTSTCTSRFADWHKTWMSLLRRRRTFVTHLARCTKPHSTCKPATKVEKRVRTMLRLGSSIKRRKRFSLNGHIRCRKYPSTCLKDRRNSSNTMLARVSASGSWRETSLSWESNTSKNSRHMQTNNETCLTRKIHRSGRMRRLVAWLRLIKTNSCRTHPVRI